MSLADHQGRRPASFRQPEAMDKDLKGAAGALWQMLCTASARLKTDGVQRKAARLLQLSPTTLNEMVHRLGLADD